MKRRKRGWFNWILVVGLLALMAGAAAGCDGDEPVGIVPTSTSDAPSDPLAAKWGDTVDLDDLLVTLEEPVDDTANLGDESWMLSEGNKAVYCMATITNTGDEIYTYNTLAFTMFDSEGLTYDSLVAVTSQPELSSGDLLPGKTVKGAVPFELPEAAVPDYVNFQRDIMSNTEASWGN